MARSKKTETEKIPMIYVLTNDKKCETYEGNRVIAVDTKEKLEIYKQQLIDNGYEDVFTIEEREHQGWSSTIRFSGYNLVEHERLLYPSKNIDFAQRKINDRLFHFKQLIENLSDLKSTVSTEEQKHYDIVIKTIEHKFNELRNQKLEIQMI